LAIASLVIGLPLVWWMTNYGLTAVGIAISIMYLGMGLMSVAASGPIVGVRFGSVMRRLMPVTVAATVAFVIVGVAHLLVVDEPTLIGELLECVVYGAIYMGLLAIVDRSRVQVIGVGVRSVGRRALRRRHPRQGEQG